MRLHVVADATPRRRSHTLRPWLVPLFAPRWWAASDLVDCARLLEIAVCLAGPYVHGPSAELHSVPLVPFDGDNDTVVTIFLTFLLPGILRLAVNIFGFNFGLFRSG